MTKKRNNAITLYICKAKRQNKTRPRTNYYLQLKDKVEVMRTCNDAGLILYEYYISKAGQPDFTFDDRTVARALDWSDAKVKKNRLKLTKNGYFLREKGSLNQGGRIVITYLDPEQIKEFQRLTTAVQTADKNSAPLDAVASTVSEPISTTANHEHETNTVAPDDGPDRRAVGFNLR